MPLYLAWFTISFCNKGQCEGKRFIKKPSLCFSKVRRGHGNTDWCTDMFLSHPTQPKPKALSPFPLQPCALDGTKDMLFSVCRIPRMLRVLATNSAVSCCDNTVPDISGLFAAPGGPSQHPLMTSPLTHPATNSDAYLGSSFPSTALPNRPAARHCSVYSSLVDTL